MPAKLRVLSGPDSGREFRLGTDVVRIGTGANAGISLNDPGLQGELTVERREGAYHVVNSLSYSIYLNQRPLRSGQSAVWFDDTILQPTADTQLVLIHDGAAAANPAGTGAAYEETAVRPRRVLSGTLILALVGIVAAILIQANAKPVNRVDEAPKSNSAIRRITAEAIAKIDGLLSLASISWAHSPLRSIRENLSEARVQEARQNGRLALNHYLQVDTAMRELQRQLDGNPAGLTPELRQEMQDILDAIGPIANQQILSLSTN